MIPAARWRKIEPVLDAALDLPSAERASFVARACAGDAALQRDVSTLLSVVEAPDPQLDSMAGAFVSDAIVMDGLDALDVPPLLASRYRVMRELGRGGMAVVYLARDERIDRFVAVKVLRPGPRERVSLRRFDAEIRLTARLQHPNIVPVFDSGEVDGWQFFVMRYVEGESLATRIASGRQSSSSALAIVSAVLAALAHAHAAGVVHRDIKPTNVMLSTSDDVLLMDFGIARSGAADDQTLTDVGTAIGTPAYMSPEQARGEAATFASDIYSTGCVLHELLTGVRPPTAATRMAIAALGVAAADSMPALRGLSNASVALSVERAMALEPADRYASASEFADALTVAGTQVDQRPVAVSATPIEVAPRERRRARVIAFLAVTLLTAGALRQLTSRPAATANGGMRVDERRVEVLTLRGGTANGADSSYAGDLQAAVVGALNATQYMTALAVSRDGSAREPVRGAASAVSVRATAVRSSVPGHAIDWRWDRSDSLRLHVVVRSAGGAEATRDFVFPAQVSALSIAPRIVNALLPSMMITTSSTALAALEERTPDVAARFLRGEMAYRAAEFTTAAAHYDTAAHADPTFALAALRGAEAATWIDHGPDAQRMVTEALRDTARLPAPLRALARGLDDYLAGRAERALASLDAAAGLSAPSPERWMLVGDVYAHLLPSGAVPDSLATDAFQHARAVDRAFVPVLYHLIQRAVRRGDGARADSLLRQFAAARPDSGELLPAQLMVQCIADGPARTRWRDYPSRAVIEAAQSLSLGGLRQPDCAEAAWRAGLLSASADDNWGALQGLQTVLVARGKTADAIAVIESDTMVNRTLRDWLYVLDAAGGASGRIASQATAATDTMYRWFLGQSKNAGLPTMWFMGLSLTRDGHIAEARRVRDAIAARARLTDDKTARYFEHSITARIALASGDTASARGILSAMRPHADAASLEWVPWESQGVDRLLLAEIELARKNYFTSARVATFVEASGPITFPIFLRRSLQIRIEAATALGDDVQAAALRKRLMGLSGGGS